jgi:hypothetical protein
MIRRLLLITLVAISARLDEAVARVKAVEIREV